MPSLLDEDCSLVLDSLDEDCSPVLGLLDEDCSLVLDSLDEDCSPVLGLLDEVGLKNFSISSLSSKGPCPLTELHLKISFSKFKTSNLVPLCLQYFSTRSSDLKEIRFSYDIYLRSFDPGTH